MDNRTRVVQYADEEDVKALCKEIAALEKRLSQAEQTIKRMQNATQFYGNIAVTKDVAIGGNVMQWDINTNTYRPVFNKGSYDYK